ncbi:MAG TPA: polysaccharide deacetylase family protein [Thermoanaerobaculia bacterium]|nr:polysaccharide deacetylase family protein [Thermoanaerobaculia bacterium]
MTERLRSVARRLIYRPLFRAVGGRLRPRAVVLLYHRIGEPAVDPHGQAVAPATFASHLEMLRSRYTVLPLPDLLDRLPGRAFPDGTVAVTFDDGYADNLTAAWPVATRLGVPFTVFVTVQPVLGGRPFRWDEREDQGRPLTVAELRELAALPGVGIGAHTMTHPRLASLSTGEQRRELAEGRERLAELTGQPVDLLAYPFGKPGDLALETPRLAEEAGYRAAFSSQAGRIIPSSPRYLLPRLSVHDWPDGELSRRLEECFDPPARTRRGNGP